MQIARRPRRASSEKTPTDRRSPDETRPRSTRCPDRPHERSSRPACRGPLAPGCWSECSLCASPSSSATVFFRCPPTARIAGTSPPSKSQLDRQRRESAGTAKRLRAGGADANDRIIDGPNDRPVVRQQRVGNRTEPLDRVLDGNGHRLFREVAARTYQRPPDATPSASGATACRAASLPNTDCRERRRGGERERGVGKGIGIGLVCSRDDVHRLAAASTRRESPGDNASSRAAATARSATGTSKARGLLLPRQGNAAARRRATGTSRPAADRAGVSAAAAARRPRPAVASTSN